MVIMLAQLKDAPIIHDVMLQAFKEYEHATPPSSALNETVESIKKDMERGEYAFIAYLDEQPVAMVRFTYSDHSVYFFRLSVIPSKQGQGLAKALLKELEHHAFAMEKRLVNAWFVCQYLETLSYIVHWVMLLQKRRRERILTSSHFL